MDSSSRLKTSASASPALQVASSFGYPSGEARQGLQWDDRSEHTELTHEFGKRLILATAILVFLVVLLRSAWIAEDAYVTFRALDNLLQGHGLRWNTIQRVQAYSNPLWLFANLPLVAVFGDPYPAALVLSLFLSLGVVVLGTRIIASSSATAVLATVILMSSRAFVEYSTSGLENPMTHFLLALLFAVYVRTFLEGGEVTSRRLLQMSTLVGLLAVNRIDTLLLGTPMLLSAWRRNRTKERHRVVLLGLVPLYIWEGFSLVYYGSLIPNTAYAKMNTGIDRAEVLQQGGIYFVDLLSQDPVSFLILLLGIVTPFVFRQKSLGAPALGLVAYLGYIVYIGGDFMSGRFFSAPVLLSCLILARAPVVGFQYGLGAGAAVLGVSLLGPNSPLTSTGELPLKSYGASGVADERSYYYAGTGLLRLARRTHFPENVFLSEGRGDRGVANKQKGLLLERRLNVGFYGFAAGPDVHIVDPLALGDPLLARLPAAYDPSWRVGHYDRVVPSGYESSIRTGRAQLADPNLNEYYRKMRRVIEGPLFTLERWKTIGGLLCGRYDSLIDKQRYRYSDPLFDRPPLTWSDLVRESPHAGKKEDASVFGFSGQSILVQGETMHLKSFRWHYASPKPSELYLLKGLDIIARMRLPATAPGARRAHTIDIPFQARKDGFDAVYFRGERGAFRHELFGVELD